MIGAIIGDIVGSIYEFDNIKTKDFPFFGERCEFTDDTVLTVAVADWLLDSTSNLTEKLVKWTSRYPSCSYGGMYLSWINKGSRRTPYGSYGNGSAMRVSPVAWVASDEGEVMALAKASAEVTHNHPEGIKGAQAAALAIWMGSRDAAAGDIRRIITGKFGYDLSRTVDEIRPGYTFDETCQKTVPQAIICALEATSFEDAIRNAISIGGDSDTVAAITGGIAEGLFGVPEEIVEQVKAYLPVEFTEIIDRFSAARNDPRPVREMPVVAQE